MSREKMLYETAAGLPPQVAPALPNLPLSGMKVVFQTADEAGCGGYRCILPAAYLRNLGAEVKWTNRISIQDHYYYNIFVYQRPYVDTTLPEEIRLLSKAGKLVLIEADDNLFKVSPKSPVFNEYKPGTQGVFSKCISEADGMIVSTPELARFYYQYNKNIAVCPNSVDFTLGSRDWSGTNDETGKKPGEVVVGWRGGVTHQEDLMLVDWKGIQDKFPQVRFAFYSNEQLVHWLIESNQLDRDRVTVIPPRNFCEYPTGLGGIDILLVPLVNSEFNDGKSELALVEAGALKIPTVCSSSVSYIRFADGNKDSWKYAAIEGWGETLTRLINDSEYRKELGQKAYERVLDKYTYEQNVVAWAQAFDNIWQNKLAGIRGPGKVIKPSGPNEPCIYCKYDGVENPPKTKKCEKHRK